MIASIPNYTVNKAARKTLESTIQLTVSQQHTQAVFSARRIYVKKLMAWVEKIEKIDKPFSDCVKKCLDSTATIHEAQLRSGKYGPYRLKVSRFVINYSKKTISLDQEVISKTKWLAIPNAFSNIEFQMRKRQAQTLIRFC